MKRFQLLFSLLFITSFSLAQSPQLNIAKPKPFKQKTFCNPMDINYQYNWEQTNEKISYRSGADPVIITHKNEYYLFHTIQGGYWKSKDLLNWHYIIPSRWPMEDMCAPAAISVRDTLYLFQSTFQQRPIFYTTTPENGKLHFYNRWLPQLPKDIGPWDPALFHDEDTDRWFMYWGSSNVYPLFGAELDKNKNLTYKEKNNYKGLIYLHPEKHGWERFGRDHRDTIKPFTEGAWMTKHNGKYYLQYGAPGTEYNVYANGTYVGDDPLGPFTYAPYNPVSYKPGGFMTGMGHGNTFKDLYGNYWNTGTPWIAVNWNFERRIEMVPAGFDKDGQMYANTRFADFPQILPTKKWTDKNELFAGWMLLSYKKPVRSSSVQDEKFSANLVTDENPRTFWVAKTNKSGETLTIDLEKPQDVHSLQINYTDYKSDIYDSALPKVYIQYRLYASTDAKNWTKIVDNTNEQRDRPNAYEELAKPVRARYIKFENVHVPMPNLAISDIRIFGKGTGKAPVTPEGLTASRQTDERNADISWQKVPDAVGYNILWGIAPDKLYQTYQIWGDAPSNLELRALTVGQKYYFAIEAFNENGVSAVSRVVGPK
ncbi:family 43 glycosylhydrolase [Emticicia sp. 21SJ11W-3]|uniref:family 43 glycosylhydrolase n=1 Tax=Emticicia sp. 21SJ11W-3 TaxID=2916755 RepID=UPI00209CCE9E|nr:family 43 glycosylhydrolase [Emticicia sp. 21SJ11W-3]UTA68088.1 family 43 glycosylhydrolase [Emticicia sp. 21SJ11W-3]